MGELSREILLANTRIRSGNVGGSGTVIFSKEGGKGYSSYVLTNHHVVENNIEVKKKWSPLLKRDIKMDVLGTVQVHFFKFLYGRSIGGTTIDADIMTYDKDEDLAILKLRDPDPAPSVAKLYPKGKEDDLPLGTDVVTIGAGLGEPPVFTKGYLSQFGREIENKEFWIVTAPSIFGNSGGACYKEETSELIGVPARLAVTMSFMGADAITHLGYIVPITRVYNFLTDQLFRFIYDSSFTEEGEEKEREKRRKEEERKMAAREDTGQEQAEEEPIE